MYDIKMIVCASTMNFSSNNAHNVFCVAIVSCFTVFWDVVFDL